MRGEVTLERYSRSRSIKLRQLSKITEHGEGEGYLYYVKNDYNPSDYEPGVTLYLFKIVKTTECFFFLCNGQRIRRFTNHKNFDRTPEGALRKALTRANNYLNILLTKARSVSDFVETVKGPNNPRELRDVRAFEAFARAQADVDDIEPEAYRELYLTGGTFT